MDLVNLRLAGRPLIGATKMDLLKRLWRGSGRTTAIASRTGSMTLKIFLDDRSLHYPKRSIPPGSHSKLILGDAIHFKNFAAWFGSNAVASYDEAETRNLLLYAGHCPSVTASIHKALRSAGLPLERSHAPGASSYAPS